MEVLSCMCVVNAAAAACTSQITNLKHTARKFNLISSKVVGMQPQATTYKLCGQPMNFDLQPEVLQVTKK